jgi:hypothetical protein
MPARAARVRPELFRRRAAGYRGGMKTRSLVTLLAAAAFAPALLAKPDLPLLADAPPRFVPEGWRLETQLDADFNGDFQADVAMVIRNDEERWLLVALGEGKGLKRIGLGELDPFPLGDASLEEKKGVLLVTDLTGGTTAIQSTYRYRYEPATGRMQLIGDDASLYSRTNSHGGIEVSTNRLTGVRLTQTSEPDEKSGEYRFGKQKQTSVPKEKLYLETAPKPEDTVGIGDRNE